MRPDEAIARSRGRWADPRWSQSLRSRSRLSRLRATGGLPGDTADAGGSFVVSGNREKVRSVTVNVESQDYHTGAHNCPTGSVTVSGPLEVKKWKIKGTQPFWAFGKLGFLPHTHHQSRAFEDAPVHATLDGQPRQNVAAKVDFGRADQKGIAFVTLDLDANHIKPGYTTSLCTPDITSFGPTK